MSTGRYLLGAAELAVIFAALGLGAYHLRALLAPAWTGALARLAEGVIGISMLILVAELLGVLGLFAELGAPARPRHRLPEDRLPLAADQPDVGGALPPRRLVRRASLCDRRRHDAGCRGRPGLGDAGGLPGGAGAERHHGPVLP